MVLPKINKIKRLVEQSVDRTVFEYGTLTPATV